MEKIGFLGGTGVEARGLALRFASAGTRVALGSRSEQRAAEAAEVCNSVLGKATIRGLSNEQMLEASDLIFLTVPFDRAVDAITRYAGSLTVKHIVVDVTVPMAFGSGKAEYVDQDGTSNSEIIARRLPPGIPLVAAFKTLPAVLLAGLETGLNCDDFVCGDSEEAKQVVMATAALIPTLRPLDAGPLRTARTLERMAVMAAALNRRYRHRGARFRVEGI